MKPASVNNEIHLTFCNTPVHLITQVVSLSFIGFSIDVEGTSQGCGEFRRRQGFPALVYYTNRRWSMRKIIMVAVAGVVLVSGIGCKRAGDVLATFKDGQITRGDFYGWMDARKMAREAILKKKSQQKSNLERFAIEKLAVREAVKAGFDKNEDFLFLKKFAKRNFYAQYMGRIMSENEDFEEKAAKARIIKLTVKNYRTSKNRREKLTETEMEVAFNEKMTQARLLVGELEKGASFEDLAKTHSDDYSKRKGGDIGYVIEGMRGEDFSRAVFAVKPGEFTREPVRSGNAVYIIKVDEVATLTPKNIEKVIEDKAQQMGMKRRLVFNSTQRMQDKLLKGKDVENAVDTANLSDGAALLFKVGSSEFKVEDLNRLIAFIEKKRKAMGRAAAPLDEKMKRDLARRILREDVLMREAMKKGVDKEENFARDLNYFIQYNLAGTYETEMVLAGITVSPAEVLDYYQKNRDRMYTRNKKQGTQTVKTVIPFNEVRQSIERRLVDMKKSEKRKTWAAGLLTQNNFKIDESELEGE